MARAERFVNLRPLLQTLTSSFDRLAVFRLLFCISLSFDGRWYSHVACKMLLSCSCWIRWNSPILQDFDSLNNLTDVWARTPPCSFNSFIFGILVQLLYQLGTCCGVICDHFSDSASDCPRRVMWRSRRTRATTRRLTPRRFET